MNNIQEATARALGYDAVTYPPEFVGTWKTPDEDKCEYIPAKDLPDPSEPNVYEAVIKLAGEASSDDLSRALAVVLGIEFDDITLDNYYDVLDQFVNADSFDRLIAALWVLGKL